MSEAKALQENVEDGIRDYEHAEDELDDLMDKLLVAKSQKEHFTIQQRIKKLEYTIYGG